MAYTPSTLTFTPWASPINIAGTDLITNLDEAVNQIITNDTNSLKNWMNGSMANVLSPYIESEFQKMYVATVADASSAASGYATAASNSATSASNSASSASSSATSASNSATSSANSATASAASALVAASRQDSHIPLSGITSYHLISGSLALQSTTIISGFATTLYTGNGATQSVTTGVDMATQWGNLATETYGGLVWAKSRSAATVNRLYDTIRGVGNSIQSDQTNAQVLDTTVFSSFNNNGFSLGSNVALNASAATYASWVFQTTHRITGTTNHGQPFTCHYNPYTGFTMVQYTGSGIAGHEIPHMLGRKLGFVAVKNLSAVYNWISGSEQYEASLNTTMAGVTASTYYTFSDISVVLPSTIAEENASANNYIMYGWANSYFDEANTLIGNYYTYVDGNGILRFRVHDNLSQSNVVWEMTRAMLTTGDWDTIDYTRGNTLDLKANLSNAETTVTANTLVNKASPAKYPKPSDTTNINLNNAVIPFANGVDTNGVKNTILSKNETISGLTFLNGKNYLYCDNTGAYGVKQHAPKYQSKSYNGFGDFYDVTKNLWYASPSVFSDTCDTTANWTTANGTLASSNGELVLTNGTTVIAYTSKLLTLTSGNRYRIKVTRSSGNDSFAIKVGTTANATDISTSGTLATTDTFTLDFVAGATNYLTLSNITATTGLINTFDNIAVFPITGTGAVDTTNATVLTASRNYLDAIVYADQNGQPTYVEQLPKTWYEDTVMANEYKGKNACTAWVNFDGTTTPPTIKDSYNVKTVVRTAVGIFDIYFDKPMDSANYVVSYLSSVETTWVNSGRQVSKNLQTLSKFTVNNIENGGGANVTYNEILVFGGKN